MDKNEVIILSSDEESDFTQRCEKPNTSNKLGLKGSPKCFKTCLNKLKNVTVSKNKRLIILNKKPGVQIVNVPKVPEKKQKVISKEIPEIVDLESSEKSVEDEQVQFSCTNNKSPKSDENHSNLDIIAVDEIPNGSNTPNNNNKIDKPDVTNKNVSNLNTVQENIESNEEKVNEGSGQNLKFFTEFVEYCGCLEEIPNDRARLTKKLMKRYGEADSSYIKSQEFRKIIQKCRDKVTKNNLYLIAKEITDELSYWKKIETNTGKSNLVEETYQRDQETGYTDKVQGSTSKQSKKRTKVINKIIKKLNKLGSKIRELEEKEVDLSDEEESSYVQLQRYRERFCQIYTKLCKYTNDVADADRIYSRKICFTESKYPAINKCLENWLNKTKRFPDFSDIMKLLESQSASLGLPSNRESIRAIAIEIFQQVGMMLQRRRKYDLWDSFCGFLDEGEDPATKDVLLDQVLKINYEIRVKKEQEIFQHFVELQEKERLEPQEVPDDEASNSPVESGNDDDIEIEAIENSLNKRLDYVIKKETQGNGRLHEKVFTVRKEGCTFYLLGKKDARPHFCVTDDNIRIKEECNEGSNDSPEILQDEDKDLEKSKESKNNFRNCKSLKWRLENEGKAKSDSVNSEESTTGPAAEKETQKKPESGISSEVDMTETKISNETEADSTQKRKWTSENEDVVPKKRKCSDKENDVKQADIFEVDDPSEISGKKTSEVFEIHRCQIFSNSVFEDWSEGEELRRKKKVFRDLTNVGRLVKLHGRRRKTSGLFFPPSFFHECITRFEKPSWKKRFKVSFKLVGLKGEKCALNQDEKSGQTMIPHSGGKEKNIQNSSEGTGNDEDGDNCNGGRGNGSEGDNNEDENKKNGRAGDEVNENQHEEDEEEDENENEKEEEDNKTDAESVGNSFRNDKTEEPTGTNETPSESVTYQEKQEEETNQQTPPTEAAALSFEEESTTEVEKQDEADKETSNLSSEKETENERQDEGEPTKESTNGNEEQEKEIAEELENKTQEAEDKPQKETQELEEDKSEPPVREETDECKTSELPEMESGAEDSKLDQDIDAETLDKNHNTEDSKDEDGKAKDSIKQNEEEAWSVETEDGAAKNEEETNEVEVKDSVTKSGEETSSVETKDGVAKNEEANEVEAKETTTGNEKPMEVEANDGKTQNQEAEKVELKRRIKTRRESLRRSTASEVGTPKENADVKTEFKSSNQYVQFVNKPTQPEVNISRNSVQMTRGRLRSREIVNTATENDVRAKRKARESAESKLTVIRKPIQVDTPSPKITRRNTPSTSDEEIVKRFLLHSPSSISITPPRKLSLSKPPSQAAMQALATLRNLKGISATIVRGKPKSEDDVVVIGGSYRRRVEQNSAPEKRRRTGLPVISNVQSADATTPKIVTVQGNVSGFENSWADDGNSCNSSSIRISNVWGSLPNTFMQSGQNSGAGCSSRQNNPGSSNAVKKKNVKKTVEYVVLE